MKIIDCFPFFCETKMLLFRLEELYDYVDHFIISESNKTHSNIDKKYNFLENINLFEKFKSKIIYIKVENMPQTQDSWDRERHQRNSLSHGFSILNLNSNDIIILSDLDEIPDVDTLKILKNQGLQNGIYQIPQDMYYYNLECKCKEKWYIGTKYFRYDNFNFELSKLRNDNFINLPYKGGWHFSYFGDSSFISYKIKSFSHQEYNNDIFTNENNISEKIKNQKDLFGRDTVNWYKINISENKYLPKKYKLLL